LSSVHARACSNAQIRCLAVALCIALNACGGGSKSSDTSSTTSTSTSTSTSSTTTTATTNAADDGLIGWATAHTEGAPTGGFASVGGNAPVTCTATSMRVLRDCVYRAKKSTTSNDDTRVGAPNWSTWEVHNG